MIQNVFIVFIPVNKFGKDDFSKKRVIFDSGYVHSIELIKINRHWVYRVNRDDGIPIYLNFKSYRFTIGVNKDEKR